mmetsp:Transcript_29641/g.74578  ORF Transcript_29641/g.74578 Transcript_29641/m.74578 type:complete len:204 (+) Transcript_29641:232-843(+)
MAAQAAGLGEDLHQQGPDHARAASGGRVLRLRRAAGALRARGVRGDARIRGGGRVPNVHAHRGRRVAPRHKPQRLSRGLRDPGQLGRGSAHGIPQVPPPKRGLHLSRGAQSRDQLGSGQAGGKGGCRRRPLRLHLRTRAQRQPRLRLPVRLEPHRRETVLRCAFQRAYFASAEPTDLRSARVTSWRQAVCARLVTHFLRRVVR